MKMSKNKIILVIDDDKEDIEHRINNAEKKRIEQGSEITKYEAEYEEN